jgi:predicted ATP-dependent endonuclease of OLD family
MKITGIEIDDYRQFKNINFDFTYPEGHDKAGQPLEKVCFIGQSGTGKTTLLNVLWDFSNLISQASDSVYNSAQFNSIVDNSFIDEVFYSSRVTGIIGDEDFCFDREDAIAFSDKDFLSRWFVEGISKVQQRAVADTKKLSIYIKDSIAREADAFIFDQKDQPQSFSDFVKTDNQIQKITIEREMRIEDVGSQKNVSFGDMQSITIWQYLLKDIEDYDYLTVSRVTHIIQNTPKNKVTEKLQEWVESDPRIRLGEECLNPILSKLFLELDDSEKGKVPITLRTKKGINIPSSFLSTGTRQFLSTAIPIYKFDTKNTVVLFDEPERSLFPDVQQILVKYYTALASDAQFFFATHSPIIASAFDPCERFILHFDENGQVNAQRGIAPEGDDPNDILRQDFRMLQLMLDEGLKQYERYRRLGMQIREEGNEEKKNQLIAERLELGNRYNFAGRNA